jgi:MurNAc alpha-1-phosphate uridylyltransferase
MILAAGRGERMRPLTDSCPKPLLRVGGKALIEWHLERLARSGFRRIVINHAHLGMMLEQALGDGSRWGLAIEWSREAEALETAGGIAQALPLIGSDPFLVVNADIWCDFNFNRAGTIAAQMLAAGLDAWCVLVDNPPQHPHGDFGIDGGRLLADAPRRFTFSGIGLYRPALFADLVRGRPAPLAPLLRAAIGRGAAGAERHTGRWVDVGTPQRLSELDAQLRPEE